MACTEDQSIVEKHTPQKVPTLLELRQLEDGSWVATQMNVDVEGTGETGALAAIDYCRKFVEGQHIEE